MSEEADQGFKSVVVEDGHRSDGVSVIQNQEQEDPISSPMRSFQLLYSSQSSEEGIREAQMIPYVSSPQMTMTVHFEDTLSDEDCFQFNLIYESLAEGKTGNLTDLAIGMVLAPKPPSLASSHS